MVLTVGIMCGCSNQNVQTNDNELKQITVGIDKFEPYTYLDVNGKYTGVDIEITEYVFHKLGYEPDFKFITWSEKNDDLANGTIYRLYMELLFYE